VSGAGQGRGPGPERIGPWTPRWRNPDWWFGRTTEQLARREKARKEFRIARADLKQSWQNQKSERVDPSAQSSRARSVGGRIGEIGKVLTVAVTLPIIAAAFFGPVGLVVAVVIAILLLVKPVAADR
jgi:hypothetical protein